MGSRTRRGGTLAAVVLVLGVPMAGLRAAPEPPHPLAGFSVRLTQPDAGTLVAGRTELRAEVEADRPEEVLFVEFLVDGRMLFADSSAPYELVWYARHPARYEITVRAYGPAGQVVEDSLTTAAPPQSPEHAAFRSRVEQVEVYVRIEDRRHRDLDLQASDFEVLENEVAQPILAVEHSSELPFAVGFMVDCSGSMLDRLGMALETAGAFIDGLVTRDGDKAFVMSFADLPSTLQEFTDDTQRLGDSLDLISVGRNTRLYDALVTGSDEFSGQDGRRALLLLTDGHDAGSTATLEEAITAAQRNDVVIYPVAVGVSTRFFRERWVLQQLAERTGGKIYYLHGLDDPTRIYEDIAADLRAQYRITYVPRERGGAGEWRAISVLLQGAEHRHARLRARPGYFAE